MGVPKKHTSISKKQIRKNLCKSKGYWVALMKKSITTRIFIGSYLII